MKNDVKVFIIARHTLHRSSIIATTTRDGCKKGINNFAMCIDMVPATDMKKIGYGKQLNLGKQERNGWGERERRVDKSTIREGKRKMKRRRKKREEDFTRYRNMYKVEKDRGVGFKGTRPFLILTTGGVVRERKKERTEGRTMTTMLGCVSQ